MENPYAAPNSAVGPAPGDSAIYLPSMFDVEGRIGRIRYLVYGTAVPLLALIAALAIYTLSPARIFLPFMPFALVPVAAACMVAHRRLQDLDKPAWLIALMFVPVASIGLYMYLLFAHGDTGVNRHGAPPAPNSRNLMLSAYALIAVYVLALAVAIPAYIHATANLTAALEQAQSNAAPALAPDDF